MLFRLNRKLDNKTGCTSDHLKFILLTITFLFMKRKIHLMLFCLFLLNPAFSQTFNSLGFPSANSNLSGTSGGGAENVDVDLYSGAAKINIPIASLVSKQLSIPVSLNYLGSQGIKVQDYSGKVGLGWQLNAGGHITRVVRGFPDEALNGYLGGFNAKKVAGWIRDGIPLGPEFTGGSSGVPTADGEPDLFYINTPFFNLQFVYDETGKPITSNDSGFIIRRSILDDSFTVIDENGTVYKFGNSGQYEKSVVNLYGTPYTFGSTYYLTSIANPHTKELIEFTYVASPYNENMVHHSSTVSVFNTMYTSCPKLEHHQVTTTILSPLHLSKIKSSTGEIVFNYVFNRQDLPNAGSLTSIAVRSRTGIETSKLLRTFSFEYSYFNPTGGSDLLRLRLDKIKLSGDETYNGQEINYRIFDYYAIHSLPSRTSSSVDYWGYHTYINPQDDPMYSINLRRPFLSYAKAGVLTSISGTSIAETSINYELNTYYDSQTASNVEIGGLRVKSIDVLDPGQSTLTTNYTYDFLGKSSGQIRTPSYKYLIIACNGGQLEKSYSESLSNIYDLNGGFHGYSQVKVSPPSGGYIISKFTNFSDFPDDVQVSTSDGGVHLPPNIISSISSSYKRGLPTNVMVYNSAGKSLTEDIYQYTALNSSIEKKAYGFYNYSIGIEGRCDKNNGATCFFSTSSKYWTKVENYRLTKMTNRKYDQLNASGFMEHVFDYTYADNKFQIRNISSTDSRGNNKLVTNYYSSDPNSFIPRLSSAEAPIIAEMKNLNYLAKIHEVVNYNGSISETHQTYTCPGGLYVNNPILLSEITLFNNQEEVQRNFIYYDSYANPISSKVSKGIYSTVIYGYNNTYPIAEIKNAEYASVVTALGGAASVNLFTSKMAPTDLEINNFLAPLRTNPLFSKSFVSTSTQIPGVGVKSRTNPMGGTTYYEYDGLQRLWRIRDRNNKILEEYLHNYKVQ